MIKTIRTIFLTLVIACMLQNSLHSMSSHSMSIEADILKQIVTSENAKIATLSAIPFLAGELVCSWNTENNFFKQLIRELKSDVIFITIPVVLSTAAAQLGKWPKVSAQEFINPSLLGYLATALIIGPTIFSTAYAYKKYKKNYMKYKEEDSDEQEFRTPSPLREACYSFGGSLAGYSFLVLPVYALAKRIQATW